MLNGKGTLLYLTVFGSHLYGTNSENSDKDYKGLFLPDEKMMLLGQKCDCISYTTGDNHSKNSKEDVDIQLWSLQHWLNLLKKGDTNAIDLLFSMYAEHDVVLYQTDFLGEYKILDIKNNKAYIAYAYSQAKKYGLKGSRVGILKEVLQYFNENICSKENWAEMRLHDVAKDIHRDLYDKSLCYFKNDDVTQMLYILNKGYEPHLKLKYMHQRLVEDYNRYGERAIQAEQNQNIDWKAVSHAVRCLYQVLELIDTDFLQYPLKDRNFIKDVKQGKFPWKDVEEKIVALLAEVDNKIHELPQNNKIARIHDDIILSCYEEKEKLKQEEQGYAPGF